MTADHSMTYEILARDVMDERSGVLLGSAQIGNRGWLASPGLLLHITDDLDDS